MKTTEKRINIALTKEDLREIMFLCDYFGETPSSVLKRGLILLYKDILVQLERIDGNG